MRNWCEMGFWSQCETWAKLWPNKPNPQPPSNRKVPYWMLFKTEWTSRGPRDSAINGSKNCWTLQSRLTKARQPHEHDSKGYNLHRVGGIHSRCKAEGVNETIWQRDCCR